MKVTLLVRTVLMTMVVCTIPALGMNISAILNKPKINATDIGVLTSKAKMIASTYSNYKALTPEYISTHEDDILRDCSMLNAIKRKIGKGKTGSVDVGHSIKSVRKSFDAADKAHGTTALRDIMSSSKKSK